MHWHSGKVGGAFPPLPDTPGNGLFSDILASTATKEQVLRLMLMLAQLCLPSSGQTWTEVLARSWAELCAAMSAVDAGMLWAELG